MATLIDHGVYRIRWKSGGESVCCIGSKYDGIRWIACANWTSKHGIGVEALLDDYTPDIDEMERLG